MILDIDQKPSGLDISYIDKDGNKKIMTVPVQQYYNWIVDYNGAGVKGYRDISGKPVKCIQSKSFRRFDLLQYLQGLPEETKKELFEYRDANLVCCDIETMIGDRFPRPELAEQPVNCISAVDKNLNCVIYTTLDCARDIEWFIKTRITDVGEVGLYWSCFDKYFREIQNGDRAAELATSETKIYEDHKIWTDKQVTEVTDVGLRTETSERLFADYGYKPQNPEDNDGREVWWFEGYELASVSDIKPLLENLHSLPTICYLKEVRYFTKASQGFRSYTDEVVAIIKEHVSTYMSKADADGITCQIMQYSTEKEMLTAYFSNIVKFAPLLTFWNGNGFDKPYLFNRCKQLGIPLECGSITNDIATMSGEPKHTVFSDYMQLVEKYGRSIQNKESLKLDYIAFRVLGIGKLPYRGTLKQMYESDVPGFIAYNAIDSILIQLMHKRLNLTAVLQGLAYLSKLPMTMALKQTKQTEAFVALDTLDWLTEKDDPIYATMPVREIQYEADGTEIKLVAAFDEKRPPRRSFGGGHVKEPWQNIAEQVSCVDYSGLYPSLHRSWNISTENYVSRIDNLDDQYQHIKYLLKPETVQRYDAYLDAKNSMPNGQYYSAQQYEQIYDAMQSAENRNNPAYASYLNLPKKPSLEADCINNPKFSIVARQATIAHYASFKWKYSPNLQNVLKAQTKSEDWLHCILLNDFRGNYQWYIYVWDTRMILEHGIIPCSCISTDNVILVEQFAFEDKKLAGVPFNFADLESRGYQFNLEHQNWILKQSKYGNEIMPAAVNVYKNDRAYGYKRIQIFLRAKRDEFKGKKLKLYSVNLPFIEYALAERGVIQEKISLPHDKDGKPLKDIMQTVYLNGQAFTRNLSKLNEKHEVDFTDEFGDFYKAGDYKHHTNFLWFMHGETYREGNFNANMESAYKESANSVYGATGNEYNCYNNIEVADDTCGLGRNGIQAAQQLLNNYFSFEFQNDVTCHNLLLKQFPGQFTKLIPGQVEPLVYKDRILYIDTDSLYIWYKDVLEAIGFCGPSHAEIFAYLYEEYLGDIVNKRLKDIATSYHGESMMSFDLEYVIDTACWTGKKHYLFAMAYENGRFIAEPAKHIKVKGLDLAQSYLPHKCREDIRETIAMMLDRRMKSKQDYLARMYELWEKFQKYSIEDISKRGGVKFETYEDKVINDQYSVDEQGNVRYPEFGPRTLPQYRGMAFHNWWISKLGLSETAQPIKDGFICMYIDVNGEPFSFRIMEMPKFAPEPDRVHMFYKLIVNTVNRIADLFQYSTPLNLGPISSTLDENEDE